VDFGCPLEAGSVKRSGMRIPFCVLAVAVLVWLPAEPVVAQPVCQPGSVGVSGREPCTPCRPGTAQARAGQSDCVPCRPGTFARNEGQRACRPCPDGTRQLRQAATGCEAIPQRCAPGSFSATGLEPCLPCPAGRAQALAGSRGCIVCPAGTTTDSPGEPRCRPSAGALSDPVADAAVAAAPADCPAGAYSLTGFQPCLPCPAGAPCGQPGTSLSQLRSETTRGND